MGQIYLGVHKPVVRQILKHFPVENFVETGTHLGDTAFWASKYFKNVFTIERSRIFWEKAQNRHKHIKNIKFLFGDSADTISTIAPQLNSLTLFWLDAHWSGGVTYGENDECALLRELSVISEIKQDSFILIDDARLFLFPPPHPHVAKYWPDITQIVKVIEKKSNFYTVVVDDVIIICPQFAKPTLLEFYQDYATKKGEDSQRKSVKNNRLVNFFNGLFSKKTGKNKD